MKRVTITYHMSKPGETAENCITVPVSDWAAHALHDWDNGGKTIEAIFVHSYINRMCDMLTALAGFEDGFYMYSRPAANQYAEAE